VNALDTAVILSSYNRPRLIVDAIQSVLEQTVPCRLYIMDDGSGEATREAIASAVAGKAVHVVRGQTVHEVRLAGDDEGHDSAEVVWWQGSEHPHADRETLLPYCVTMNLALNALVREEFITQQCDDDYLYPESVEVRRSVLLADSTIHVVYGRLRMVQYGQIGLRNLWMSAGTPQPGRSFPRPTGPSILSTQHHVGRFFFDPSTGETDPETRLPYVEEGAWHLGPTEYGKPMSPDHNQVMYRRACLTGCYQWPDGACLGGTQFWGELLSNGVGDAQFFRRLGDAHAFHGVDAWVATKRYHVGCGGSASEAKRE